MTKEELKKKFEELEADNEHGEALLLVLRYFKRDLDVKKVEHINALHVLYGCLTDELNTMRYEIWKSVRELYYKEVSNG